MKKTFSHHQICLLEVFLYVFFKFSFTCIGVNAWRKQWMWLCWFAFVSNYFAITMYYIPPVLCLVFVCLLFVFFVDQFLHVWKFCIVALRHGIRHHNHLRLWLEARKGCSKGKQSHTRLWYIHEWGWTSVVVTVSPGTMEKVKHFVDQNVWYTASVTHRGKASCARSWACHMWKDTTLPIYNIVGYSVYFHWHT